MRVNFAVGVVEAVIVIVEAAVVIAVAVLNCTHVIREVTRILLLVYQIASCQRDEGLGGKE